MWVAKFKIRHDDWILSKTLKYNIYATGVPLNSFRKKGMQYHTAIIFLHGSTENKLKFIESLKKDNIIKEFDVKGNQVFVLIEGKDAITHAFDESLFLVQPVLLKEGHEYWEISAWERKKLVKFYNESRKIADVEMLKLKKELPFVFVQHNIPDLTEKQRKAFELAKESGYYNYPRKTTVEELAKKIKIPRTTFQEHLRKAESKLMNMLVHSLNK